MFWPTEELEKIPYKNNFFIIEPFSQHHLFRVRLERGETPKEFHDKSYTSVEKAKSAVTLFVQSKVKE